MGKRICCCICPCFSAPDEVEAVRTDPSGAQEASSANNSNSVVADSGKGGSSSETGGPSAHHDHDSANSNNKRGGEGCSSSVSQEAPSAHAHVTDGHGGDDSANNSNSVVGDSAEGGSSSETGGPSAHHDHDSANSDNKRGGEGCSSSGSAHAHAHGGQDSSSSSNVNLDDLINHISQLLHQIKEKSPPQRQQTPHYIWPTSSPGFLKLQEFLSRGIDFASAVKDVIPSQHSTEAKAVVLSLLKGIARAHVVTAGLLVVANILERFEAVSDNRAECLSLLDEMNRLAKHVKQLKERRGLRQGMENIIEEAVELIVEASLMCCTQIDSSTFSRFFTTSVNKGELVDFQQKLQKMYNHMKNQVDICIFDAIDAIACRNGRPRKPRERGYPEYAVGIEEPTQEVIKLLEWESEKNAWGVVLYGFGGIGKTTVADAVFARLYIEECKYSMVSLFGSITSTPNIVELQKCILKDLMVGTATEEKEKQVLESIVTFRDGQREIQGLLEKEMAFIYIDNVLEIEPLALLLPHWYETKPRKLRILMTARDTEVRTACKFETKGYGIEVLPKVEAVSLLKKEMYSYGGTDVTGEQMSHRQLSEIAQICGGIPRLLSLVAGFIRCEDDKQRAVRIIMEEKEKWKGKIGKYIEHYVFAYESLPPLLKDPFLDICKFFNGWQWDEVADILGESNLDMLQKRALVTRDTNMTTQVHDVILKVAEDSDKGMRLTLTSASQIQDILYQMEQKDLQGMKGLWLREIKIEDPLQILASKLDFMHRSLRILSLGDITVEGKCAKKFENLVFFQSGLGSIDLPFDVSKSKELTYLAYHQPEENVNKMSEDLKKDAIDRMRRSQVLQISSRYLRPLQNLRILRLIGLAQLEKLPADLGDLNGLHELTLSRVPCIEELPPTISKLQSLRVLRLHSCSRFRKLPEELGGGLVNSLHKLILSGCNLIEELPDDFGSLKSLQELNLSQCNRLVAFPSSFKNLSSLRSLNISGCESLQYLPPDLGSLTSLVELNLSFCKNLISIPDSIGQLKLLAFSMDIRCCESLTQLPDQFCQLSFITHLELDQCKRLEKLPDAFGKLESLGVLSLCYCGLKNLPEGFGQLKSLVELNLLFCNVLEELSVDFHRLSSLRILNLGCCTSLKKLPEDFHCLESLEVLSLVDCSGLQRLPEGFCQLGSLRVLDLRFCISLTKLPEGFGQLNSLVELNLRLCKHLKDLCIDFHCLNSLEYLKLDDCNKLQGKWMDDVVKLKALGNLDVRRSPMLVQRLTEIQRECHQSWRFIVKTGQGLFEESNSKNREDALSKLSSKLDTLLTNGVGETFNVSALPLNTVVLLMFDGNRKSGDASAAVEYAIKHRPINFETIYIGRHFNSWPRKIAHRISAHAAFSSEALLVVEKITSTYELHAGWRDSYFQMSAKIVEDGKGGKYLSCWEYLGDEIRKDFVLINCEGYLQLKQVEETPQSSNINMLRELFACGEKEETMATDIFLKDYGAHKVGVDKLQGKIILLHLGSLKEIDILRDVLTEGYVTEKERSNLEIISIVKGSTITEVERFAKEVPWLVHQYPRTITKAKRYFLYEKCSWKWESDKSEWVIPESEDSTGIMVIERNGRIPSYEALPVRIMLDRWGWKAYPFTGEKLEELKEKEWNDLPHFSPLMFLVKHLGEVKERMLSPKKILLCGGVEDESGMTEFTSFLRDEFKGQWDSIHLIYVPRVEFGEVSEVAMRDAEMEGMTLLTLSKHDTIRFWERVLYLSEEIEGMDEQSKGVGTMETLLKFCDQSFDWATLMGKDGELISYMDRKGLKRSFHRYRKSKRRFHRYRKSMDA